MSDRLTRFAAGFGLALIALHAVGYAAPTVFTWGVHFFGFLPRTFFILYLLLALGGIWAAARGRFDGPLRRLGEAVERRPGMVIAVSVLAFAVMAVLFRVRVPLLGDSFIAVKLYENRLASPEFTPTAHEFLSFGFFYSVMKLLGMTTYPAMADAFLIAELLLGAVFLAAAAATVRLAVEDAAARGAALLLVTALPYLQLFFGYVENYALNLTVLALYALAALLYLRGRFPFVLLPLVFAVVFLTHYLNAALGLSLVYLGFHEVRQRGWKNIGLALAAVAALGLAGWLAAGPGLRLLVPPARHSPILSVAGIANAYQPYTLFSPVHFLDLANLALLVAPAALFLLAAAAATAGRAAFAAPFARFLGLASGPAALVFCLLQFDLPMAIDWDIPAPYVYPVALLAAAAALPALGASGLRAAAILLAATLPGTLAWWSLNASVDPAIERAKIFLDPRISSPDGSYQSALHLTEWYVRQQDHRNIREISERFIGMYPDDSRGYMNYTLYLMQFGPSMEGKIRETFDRWLARDSSNASARSQYAHFELDVGQRAYREGQPAAAARRFEKAIALDSSFGEAYNSMGLAVKALGQLEAATGWYRRTIELDPLNVSAYINLGNAFDDLGRPDDAIGWYEKALSVRPDSPAALYNLGVTYAKTGNGSAAVDAMRRAARLGMTDAQAYLQERGITW